MTEDELEEINLVDLDLGRLEEHFVIQPRLYRHYSRKLADAKLRLNQAKANEKLAEAEAQRMVRNKPAKYGLKMAKPTEPAIKARALSTTVYQGAIKALNKAQHVVDLLDSAVTTCEHRKRAIEGLVSLWTSDYFAKPKTPKGEQGEKLRAKMNEEESRKAFQGRPLKRRT